MISGSISREEDDVVSPSFSPPPPPAAAAAAGVDVAVALLGTSSFTMLYVAGSALRQNTTNQRWFQALLLRTSSRSRSSM